MKLAWVFEVGHKAGHTKELRDPWCGFSHAAEKKVVRRGVFTEQDKRV